MLTPHTYLLNAATVLTDTLYLNALGNANAVFVIKMNGAFSTSTYSKILLINGAQSKNVYWKIEGAVSINDHSVFRGTLICNNGSLGAIKTGVTLDGRALTTTGALTTTSVNAIATMIPGNCSSVDVHNIDGINNIINIYPNPFNTSATILFKDVLQMNKVELKIYNVLGDLVIDTILTKQSTTINTNELPNGLYTYKLISNNEIIEAGKLISQN